MPIRPEMKARYPANWEEIRERILARAGNCCERCGVANHAWGHRDDDGTFVELRGWLRHQAICAVRRRPRHWVEPPFVYCGVRYIRIVLTIAHVHDHAPENCADDNLQALCQRCHLQLDAKLHAATRRARRAVADLFEGLR